MSRSLKGASFSFKASDAFAGQAGPGLLDAGRDNAIFLVFMRANTPDARAAASAFTSALAGDAAHCELAELFESVDPGTLIARAVYTSESAFGAAKDAVAAAQAALAPRGAVVVKHGLYRLAAKKMVKDTGDIGLFAVVVFSPPLDKADDFVADYLISAQALSAADGFRLCGLHELCDPESDSSSAFPFVDVRGFQSKEALQAAEADPVYAQGVSRIAYANAATKEYRRFAAP